ncbi:MAG: response regulator [Candidatus Omnitrophica bacterium]|nr:response regulator [Candidatus Omnitrophota bacterium]
MSNLKILIVDDEEGIRESLKLILEDYYNLILAEDGEQALEILENSSDIALVLMDIKMPKMSGLETLESMKEKHAQLKVIIVTGYKSVETATEAVRLGASGYIVKPFKSDEVLATVRSTMKK